MRKAAKHEVIVFECGLVINPSFPFLGASPDGKVYDPSVDIKEGILEIKCPFKYRDETPVEACSHPDFFCELIDGHLKLKKNSLHYSQVQGQMAICQVEWCDFVIYTKAGLNVERISFDEKFWLEELFPKLLDFYLQHAISFFTTKLK